MNRPFGLGRRAAASGERQLAPSLFGLRAQGDVLEGNLGAVWRRGVGEGLACCRIIASLRRGHGRPNPRIADDQKWNETIQDCVAGTRRRVVDQCRSPRTIFSIVLTLNCPVDRLEGEVRVTGLKFG